MRPAGALAALSLSTLLSSLGVSIANVGLPAMSSTFEASLVQVQWVVSAYLLAMTVTVVSAGRLGDRWGRRRLLLGGAALFSAASLLSAVAPTLPLLIVARMAQGIGAAVMTALAMALVGETVPARRTGSAIGLLGTMSAVGTALGPSLGGILIAWAGWRATFIALVPLGLLALGLAHRHLSAPSAIDPPRARVRNGSVGGALWRGLAMSTLVSTVVMATLVVGPFYLSSGLSLDIVAVGIILSAGPVVAALCGVPAGRAVDRFGADRSIVAGLVAMALGSVALAAVPTIGIAGYISAIAVLTAGYALFQAANNTSIMGRVEPERRGALSGMLTLARNLGLVAGASLMGAVFAAAGMRFTFAVATLLVLSALAIAMRRREGATARRSNWDRYRSRDPRPR